MAPDLDQIVTGLDNVHVDDFDPLATDDTAKTYATYDELRKKCPVAHTSAYGGYWMLTRHADIKAAAGDPRQFISSVKAVIPSDPRGLRRPPLNYDAPKHGPFRKALDRTMKPARVTRLEAVLLEHAENELEPMLEAGAGDICQDFGARFPAWVEAVWLNLQEEDAPLLADTASKWVMAWRNMDKEEVGRHSGTLYNLARSVIADRKANPRDPDEDPVSSLLAERTSDGEPLGEEELTGAVRQALVVGMVAPPILIGSIAKHLAEDVGLQDELRADPSLIPAAVEEFIRLYTPYRGFARTAACPVSMHGKTMSPSEPVAMTYAAANRDPEVFERPNEFILGRKNISQHLGFGYGSHRCIGMPLARLAIQVALKVLLRQTSAIELTGEGLAYARMPELGIISCPLKLVRA